MEYREIKGNLFTVGSEYVLAHCISTDFALGAGIAVEFTKRYDMRRKLISMYRSEWNNPKTIGRALYVDGVFNLVTKVKCFHKPTYDSLRLTLEDMKLQCVDRGITYVALPLIGSGLDKLQWGRVSLIIQEVFKDTECVLMVYKLRL